MLLLVVLLAPVWLGPAYAPVVRALGAATAQHHCACGMKRGQCGCPTCIAEDQERQHPSRHMIVRNTCDSDDFVPTFAVAPQAVARNASMIVPVAVTRARDTLPPAPLHDGDATEPPTPPPRRG